jgi:hypothetical protein
LLVLALIAGAPQIASAQFTTFIPPKNTVADSVKVAVAAEQKAQADSVSQAQITNMKTWVDSAAGLVPEPTTAADSVAAGVTATTTVTDSTGFRNGMRAPATASNLPLLVLAGLAMVFAGFIVLRGNAPTPARVRSNGRA